MELHVYYYYVTSIVTVAEQVSFIATYLMCSWFHLQCKYGWRLSYPSSTFPFFSSVMHW